MKLASLLFISVLAAAGCSSSSTPSKKDAGSDAQRDSGGTEAPVDQGPESAVDMAIDPPLDMATAGDMAAGETPSSCSEVTGSPCASPMKCGLSCTTMSVMCLMAGAKVLGDVCMTENECGAGLSCTCSGMPAVCNCRKYCRADTDCAAGKLCNTTLSCTGDPAGTIRARVCAL